MPHITAVLPDYLEKIVEIGSYQEAIHWFTALPWGWQVALGLGTIGVLFGLFMLVFGSILR